MTYKIYIDVVKSAVEVWLSEFTSLTKKTEHNSDFLTQLVYYSGEECSLVVNLNAVTKDSVTVLAINGSSGDTETQTITFKENLSVELPMETIPKDILDKIVDKLSSITKSETFQFDKSSKSTTKQATPPRNESMKRSEITVPVGIEENHTNRPDDMPDFDDEYEMMPKRSGSAQNTQQFPNIGESDLNPPGIPKYPELKPYLDHRNTGEGGMYPSMDHPLFQRGGRRGTPNMPGVPPGARYDDPLGEMFDVTNPSNSQLPFGGPRGGPSGFGSGSGGPGGFGF